MERAIIQNNTSSIERIENFVRAVCDDNHIPNFFATISVPVLKAAELAFHVNPVSQIIIIFEHCRGGVRFTIQAGSPCFEMPLSSEIPPSGSEEESLYLVKILTDQMSVLDNGCDLQMTFYLMGIDFCEAAYRVQVLKNFYAEQRRCFMELVEG